MHILHAFDNYFSLENNLSCWDLTSWFKLDISLIPTKFTGKSSFAEVHLMSSFKFNRSGKQNKEAGVISMFCGMEIAQSI